MKLELNLQNSDITYETDFRSFYKTRMTVESREHKR